MAKLQIDIAFFEEDELICRGTTICGAEKTEKQLAGVDGLSFRITSVFKEPACPVEIVCHRDGKQLYNAALLVGVHTSEDWESINLGDIHTLGFRCMALQ